LERDAGKGLPKSILDYAFWLDDPDRPHWLDPGPPPDVGRWIEALYALDRHGDKNELVALLRSDASLPQTARKHLTNLIERYRVEPMDKCGDKKDLVALLSDDLPREGREFLADLLEGCSFEKKRGGQGTPAYDLSDVERLLELAKNKVRERHSGTSVDEALDQASESFGIDRERLDLAYHGRRGSSNRLKKRRK
jgi:hypothetical protein